MNNRERMLMLVNRRAPDQFAWAGDMDYWYSSTKARGALPEKYQGDGYFQLNRDLGMGFYLQGFGPYLQQNRRVSFSESRDGDRLTRTMHTPKGDLTEI